MGPSLHFSFDFIKNVSHPSRTNLGIDTDNNKTAVSVYRTLRTCFGKHKKGLVLKGQMNQKNDIFSFVALPSPNTKKNHPK